MQSVGFKEWALVCDALGRGEQTILLRKGGIAEGREGFGFKHAEFFLFPTFFHEQLVKVRTPDAKLPAAAGGEIEIRYLAKLEDEKKITEWSEASSLAPFHILSESVVRDRFEYKDAGLNIALVRVFRLDPVWSFPNNPSYGGCRSWVNLPELPAEIRLHQVLTDQQYEEYSGRLRAALTTTSTDRFD